MATGNRIGIATEIISPICVIPFANRLSKVDVLILEVFVIQRLDHPDGCEEQRDDDNDRY